MTCQKCVKKQELLVRKLQCNSVCVYVFICVKNMYISKEGSILVTEWTCFTDMCLDAAGKKQEKLHTG